MAEDIYKSLTLTELRFLAEREGVKNADPYEREELIDILEEIWEEKIADRKLNNDIMRLKGKKYDIYREDLNGTYRETEYVIPENYPKTSIQLLLRDPFWAYAYWDINQFELQVILTRHPNALFYLRVYEMKQCCADPENILGSFDIPIKVEDSSWYINLPNPGRVYQVDLICEDADGELKQLCRSTMLESPGGYWLNNPDELRHNSDDFKLFLAGYSNGSDHLTTNILIQRILADLEDSKQNLRSKE